MQQLPKLSIYSLPVSINFSRDQIKSMWMCGNPSFLACAEATSHMLIVYCVYSIIPWCQNIMTIINCRIDVDIISICYCNWYRTLHLRKLPSSLPRSPLKPPPSTPHHTITAANGIWLLALKRQFSCVVFGTFANNHAYVSAMNKLLLWMTVCMGMGRRWRCGSKPSAWMRNKIYDIFGWINVRYYCGKASLIGDHQQRHNIGFRSKTF